MLSLSVCMIVKNEEKMLSSALESVKDADEIIVCDTGSTDRTIEIATQYTDKVYTDFTWCDDFAAARNHADSKATYEWRLQIDADETLEPGGIQKIRECLSNDYRAFHINVCAVNDSQEFRNVRVYHRDCCWAGAIHNHLTLPLGAKSGFIPVQIKFGYSPAHKSDPDRSIRILQKEYEKDVTNPRTLYYLAREHWYRRQYDQAIKFWEECVKYSRFKAERADAYLYLARCYWLTRQGERARTACLQALNINANFREAALFMADISWPENARVWRAMADVANDQDVLFVRTTKGKEQPADYYDRLWLSASSSDEQMDRRVRPIWDEVLKALNSISGALTVVDLGCGPGQLAEFLNKHSSCDFQYEGYDFSAVAIRRARARDLGSNISFHQRDLSAFTPLRSVRRTVYVLTEVLEHISFDLSLLSKIPPNTDVLFSVPTFNDPSHVRVFKDEEAIRSRYDSLLDLRSITKLGDGFRFFCRAVRKEG